MKSLLMQRSLGGFWRYLSNTAWLIAEQVLRMVSGIFVGIYVARHLGPANFGMLNYAVSFVSIFGATAKLGFDAVLVRDLLTHQDKILDYLGTTFWLKFIAGFFGMTLIIAGSLATAGDLGNKALILIISLSLVFQAFEVIDFYFQSKVSAKYISVCKVIQLSISAVLKLVFIYVDADLVWFAALVLFDAITLAVFMQIAFRLGRKGLLTGYLTRFNLRIAKEMLAESWPLCVSAVSTILYMRVDQLMISSYLGDHALGIYSAAIRLTEVWYFVPMVISSSIYPALINARNSNYPLYVSRVQRLYSFLIWSGIAIAVFGTLFGGPVVHLLYGPQFHEAANIVAIHIWTVVFMAILVSSGKFLTAESKSLYILERNLLAAVSNFFLNLLLIPKFGLQGAALSAVIGVFISAIAYDFIRKTSRQYFLMKWNGLIFRGVR